MFALPRLAICAACRQRQKPRRGSSELCGPRPEFGGAVGENVAAGPESAAEAMQGWEGSPTHCSNLMDPEFTELGIAYAASPRPTGHSTWWSMVLARPRAAGGRK